MTPDLRAKIDELRRLAEAAAARPWVVRDGPVHGSKLVMQSESPSGWGIACMMMTTPFDDWGAMAVPNGDYLCAAANLAPVLAAALEAAEAEIERLKRGDLTPEEFQNLCHNLHEKPGCTLAAFAEGCREYQRKLFGASE